MAFINGKFLQREERQNMIDAYKDLVDFYLYKHELDDSEILEYEEYSATLEKLERVHRAEIDNLYFCYEYFSETNNPDNGGNWEDYYIEGGVENAAEFHKEICGYIDHVSNVEKNAKLCVVAPRAHAKSSYLSKGNPLREICFRKRKFIIMISETPSIAKANLEWISGQLKANKKLQEDFGILLSHKQNKNPKDNSEEFITWQDMGEDEPKKLLTYCKSFSTNQAIRGQSWNGARPDMICCDDIEGIHSNAGTPEQRAKLKAWFDSDVLPLGDPKGERSAYIYMGTIVHHDALLPVVYSDYTEFKGNLYRAIIKFPNRMDLWDECKEIYNNPGLTKDERQTGAKQYYKANKELMDDGAVVLWKEVQPIYKLMEKKWRNNRSFQTEYQNDPRDEESQIFVSENFEMFKDVHLQDQPVTYYSFWDVASGKNLKRTDYNAIVTVAKNRRTGVFYVVDAWAKKCKMNEALKVAAQKIEQFRPYKFGVEDIGVGFQAPDQLKELLRKKGLYFTRIVPVSSHSRKKNDRIAALEPLVEQGHIQFKSDQQLLFDQMEQFPGGTNDDLPDGLSSAVELAGAFNTQVKTSSNYPKIFRR
ncbi:hypothetical protein Q9251_02970 [Alkalihalobacillus macyae]|uniref:phage terminase large subunit family protein n=1 Tax=Guptibacillus hwajinpoensis TaxID=208199 RepID=UPI00273A9A6C|nr:hypothetical protein [Alkalihalobacillus macyae]MDP4549837.1 hypothetical protein [Alkalihalobacillus macyae]